MPTSAGAFFPRAETLPLLVEVTVAEGDRLDLIAARTLGDPEQFWRVCDANNAMNPADLMAPGRILRVPVPQVEAGSIASWDAGVRAWTTEGAL